MEVMKQANAYECWRWACPYCGHPENHLDFNPSGPGEILDCDECHEVVNVVASNVQIDPCDE
jgi:hypothetical protein